MTTLQFLAEWALRSSILILLGALLLRALRVKDASIRLAAWTVLLFGSLAIPLLTAWLPKVSVVVTPSARIAGDISPSSVALPPLHVHTTEVTPFDWTRGAVVLYFVVAFALLLRLCIGLAMGFRLLHGSPATGQATEGIEIRESRGVTAPVTLGIAHPAIVLPRDWRCWGGPKLDAVLAHERSHIRRHDPAVQLISNVHRALLWFSPLSWVMHRQIVRVAEEVSDDAAVAATADRALYAEVLLEFMQRGVRNPVWQGVPMARYGRQEQRIQRILDGSVLSRGVTRRSMAVILAVSAPLAYLAAAADRAPALQAPVRKAVVQSVAPVVTEQTAPEANYLRALGSVAADTVIVRPRVDGQLMSLSFKEGDMVQAGQVVATIDSRPYDIQYTKAQSQLEQDQALLAQLNLQVERLRELLAKGLVPRLELDRQVAQLGDVNEKMKIDQAAASTARLDREYTQIRAPITGVAGLRLIDVGNVVHAGDGAGILSITQLHPIAILFQIPQDTLPQVRARLAKGANPRVEAWSRDDSKRIAIGQLTATDNQIDAATGTIKLKAQFDGQDGALFPNQFVNVHLFLDSR